MAFRFNINGKPFWISQTIDGYRWITQHGHGKLASNLLEAQQNAINTVQRYIEEESFALILDNDDYHDQRRCENE